MSSIKMRLSKLIDSVCIYFVNQLSLLFNSDRLRSTDVTENEESSDFIDCFCSVHRHIVSIVLGIFPFLLISLHFFQAESSFLFI